MQAESLPATAFPAEDPTPMNLFALLLVSPLLVLASLAWVLRR